MITGQKAIHKSWQARFQIIDTVSMMLSFANNRSGQKVAMPQYVHTGDGGRRVVELRQSFPRLVALEETDIACPGSGAFSIHGSSGNKKRAFS
jgi:hypothetical protein